MMSVLLSLAVQGAAIRPEPPITKACIRDNSIEVSKGAAQNEWNEAWRETLMLCRSVRQAWFSWKFAKLKSEHPNLSDEGMANTIVRLLEEFDRDNLAMYINAYRYPSEIWSHGKPAVLRE